MAVFGALLLASCLMDGRNAASVPNEEFAMYDTIVVGLGSAGTMAATTLARAGKKVLALEAQNRIGGRVHTVPFGDGVVELGAEWIHGQQNSRVYDLAVRNNISVVSQDISLEVYRSDGTLGDKDVVNDLVGYALEAVDHPPAVAQPLGQHLTTRVLDYMQEKYPDLRKDQDFVTEFLAFLDLLVDNYEASTSWNDITTDSRYEDLEGDLHLSWHRYGYKTFFEIMLNTYNNGPGLPTLEYKLNTEVTEINWPQDPKKKVIVHCKDGQTYTAENVIVTVSVGVLKERHATLFTPVLPQKKIDAILNIHMGLLDKIILQFPYEWWSNRTKIYGFMWKGDDRRAIDDEFMMKLGAVSRPLGTGYVLTIWTYGDTGRMSSMRLSMVLITCKFYRHTTLFSPSLPEKKVEAIDHIKIGVAMKIILEFPVKWYPDSQEFEFIWRGVDKMAANDSLWTKIGEAIVPMGCGNVLTLWSTGERAKSVSTINNIVYGMIWNVCQNFGANINFHFYDNGHASLFSPPLPEVKRESIKSLTIGVMDKIILLFPHKWWPNHSTFFGFIWKKEERKEIREEDMWITQIFGASTPFGCRTALTLWTNGAVGIMIESLPDDVVKTKSMELLRRFMCANITIPEPVNMLRSYWHTNPYTKGSYTYDHIGTNLNPTAREDLAEPLRDSAGTPRVLFAGEATDPTHFSTVHGAADTGHREAARLLPSSKL